jgi:hypothetical protein
MYLRAAAGSGLCNTAKFLCGAAGIGLGTTAEYLRVATSAAASSGLGTTTKYLVHQNAGAGGNVAKAHIHKSWARIQMKNPCSVAAFVVNLEPQSGARPSVRVCVWGPSFLAVFI